MDVIDFAKEKIRMCYSFGSPGEYHCDGCLLEGLGGCSLEDLVINDNIEEAVNLVEEWAALNPRITYQNILLKNYPLARIDSKNTLYVCPADLYGDDICPRQQNNTPLSCQDCRHDFWDREVK